MISITGMATVLTNAVTGFTIQNPMLLLWSIPAIILIIYLINRTFVDVREDNLASQRKRRARRVMIITRILIIVLLALAFATPASIEDRTIQSEPFVKILLDNSSSMAVFDASQLGVLEQQLADDITVKTASLADGERSAIGQTLLSRITKGDNVLLVTDGQVTDGPSLEDVALFAAANNITLSMLRLPTIHSDAWVTVDGPAKVAAGVENTFTVTVGTIGTLSDVKLTVTIDGESVLDTTTGAGTQTIKRTLTKGTHRIIATIDSHDTFSQNNIFYKTVKAVPEPKVFFWSEKTNPPLLALYKQVYDVDVGATLPANLDSYYAVIINDLTGLSIPLDSTQNLNTFVTDGGGLLVVGGQNSYDRGGYGTVPIGNMLPVYVGSPGKDLGDMNVVVLIDASESSSGQQGAGIEISRQLTLGLINNLDPKVRVGVVAFQTSAQVVSELALKGQTAELVDKVSRIQGAGQSNMAEGLQLSINMLSKAQGSKNLVIISDGLLLPQIAAQSRTLVQQAMQQGIKVYTVGAAVGDDAFIQERIDEDFMKELAGIAHGSYFRASTASRLKLLFNPPKDEAKKNTTDRQATVIDSNHFITQGFLFKDATLTGYNAIIPKSSGTLLATLSSGEPLLVVSRLGLGRVASLGTDDGTSWSGPLMNADNSPFLLRTLNWAIGDPDRKEKNKVDVVDGTVGEPLQVTVTADAPPVSKETTFVRTAQNTYTGSLTPTQVGFVNILNATAAVNGPREYGQLGESNALTRAVGETDGRIFAPQAVEQLAAFAKTKSLQVVHEEVPLRWPLAIAIFIIWLIELILRRMLGKS